MPRRPGQQVADPAVLQIVPRVPAGRAALVLVVRVRVARGRAVQGRAALVLVERVRVARGRARLGQVGPDRASDRVRRVVAAERLPAPAGEGQPVDGLEDLLAADPQEMEVRPRARSHHWKTIHASGGWVAWPDEPPVG